MDYDALPAEITDLLSHLDSLGEDDVSALTDRLQARFGELKDVEQSPARAREMAQLGHAADAITQLASGRKVEALSASSPSGGAAVQKMARRRPTPSPEAQPRSDSGALIASVGHLNGKAITSRRELGQLIGDAAWQQVSNNTLNQKTIVASAKFDYPEGRKLGMSYDEIHDKIAAVCGPQAPAYDPRTGQPTGGALIATGGTCQPVDVDYGVPVWATPETPIADGLPSFEATRGGIIYVAPPDLAEWEGATGIWTEATDAEPNGATKAIKTLSCGEEKKVLVEAVSTRIGFGNMQARFAPEQVAANTELAFAAAARIREENLLNLIEEVCVKKLETAQHLGAARDLLSAVDFAVGAYRNIHRLPDTQSFTAILPRWVKDLIRADMAREQAHDNSGSVNVWAVKDAQIDGFFADRYINVIWHLDGQKEPSSKNYESQYAVATHVAEGKKLDEIFPAAALEGKGLAWYLFPEGAIQRLDAGRLDLGVVRDSTLDATNDFETFVEVFESIAGRVFAKGAWQILSVLKATGGSSGTVTAVAP